jgi:hypothetical protein
MRFRQSKVGAAQQGGLAEQCNIAAMGAVPSGVERHVQPVGLQCLGYHLIRRPPVDVQGVFTRFEVPDGVRT